MSIQAFFAGAYTIGKSARSFFSHILFYIHSKKGLDLSHKEDIPGPGQYDVSFNIKNNGSEWKIFKKKRSKSSNHLVKKNNEPSPFSYNLKSVIGNAPKFTFGSKISEKNNSSLHLGPSSYNPNYFTKDANPSFSFGYKDNSVFFARKTNEFKKEDSKTLNQTIEFMNKLEKYHSKGIEKYKDTSEIIQKQNKSSNKKKKNIFSNIIQAEKKQKEKVKTEIKSAFTDRIKLISPGPGFYQLNFANMINGPVIKFAESQREDFYKINDQNKLGPGSFEISRDFDLPKIKSARKISEENRYSSLDLLNCNKINKIMKTKITPGPGLYNPEKTYSKISTKFSKAKRKDLSNPQKIPGPGAYKPQLYEITKGSKFTKSIKDSSYITASNEVPGPGKYDIYEKLSKSGLNTGIQKPLEKGQSYMSKLNKNPGPFDYFPNYDFIHHRGIDGIQFTRLKRFQNRNSENSALGPGQYLIKNKHDGLQYSFMKRDESKRVPSLMKMLYPGPGSYEIQSNIAVLPNYMK